MKRTFEGDLARAAAFYGHVCGEEIIDGREVSTGRGSVVCRSCAGQSYYEMV